MAFQKLDMRRKRSAERAGLIVNADCRKDLSHPLVQPRRQMDPQGVNNRVRVLVRGNPELAGAESRHHDVIAVRGTYVIGIRGGPQLDQLVFLALNEIQ